MSGDLATRSEALVYVAETSQALASVQDASEAKRLLDKTATAQELARRINLDQEARDELARLQFRIRRQLGEILAADGERRGGSKYREGTLPDGVSRKLSSQSQQIAALDEEDFERFLTNGKELTLKRLLRIAREAKPVEAVHEPSAVEVGSCTIRRGNFQNVLNDVSDVDAIITDPPYPWQFIDEFDALGELSKRILSPDGFLLAMVGQAYLPEYVERLSRHLTYRWCGAYLTEGPATRVHGRQVGTKWKPLLLFDRAGARGFITQDVFSSAGRDKVHHSWGQSESGMADIVYRLTRPGDLVVDPFLGAGTTGVVCRDLGRNFIGCDHDPVAFGKARERLEAA